MITIFTMITIMIYMITNATIIINNKVIMIFKTNIIMMITITMITITTYPITIYDYNNYDYCNCDYCYYNYYY